LCPDANDGYEVIFLRLFIFVPVFSLHPFAMHCLFGGTIPLLKRWVKNITSRPLFIHSEKPQ